MSVGGIDIEAGPSPSGPAAPERRKRRATLGACCGIHSVHDGFSDVIYFLLPLWQLEFALTLTVVGIIKSLFSAALAVGQIPAGLLAEKLGERRLLVVGTAVTGGAFVCLGFAEGVVGLIGFLVLAGFGSSVQHPLCASLVSRVYEGAGQRRAIGIYNFAGDVGKAVVPALAGLLVGILGWRLIAGGYGAAGIAMALVIGLAFAALGVGAAVTRARAAQRTRGGAGFDWGIGDRHGFALLAVIEVIDGASRTACLTFLPFLLLAKGIEAAGIGFALALVFIGGAAGKFLCGMLAERFGITASVVLTEALTGALILVLLVLPLGPSMGLLPFLGAMLNGTSSVLYGTLPEFVSPERRARGFGLFYTLGIGGGATAPFLFGVLSDATSVTVTLACLSAMIFLTIPLALLLGRRLNRNSVGGVAA